MTKQNLLVTISSPSSGKYESCWVRVEQIIPDKAVTAPNVTDVYNLWLTAATGRSARKLRPASCPVEFDGNKIKTLLGFYIWPSYPGLQYGLIAALGEIGQRQNIYKHREFSVFIDHANRYALPYYMQGVSVTWETPIYDDNNEQITRPTVTLVDGIWLVFSESVFAAIRVSGTAVGASVVLEMTIEKGISTSIETTDADLEVWRRGPNGEVIVNPLPIEKLIADTIKDLKNTITVVYICKNSLGSDSIKNDDIVAAESISEQVSVVIPECLVDLLSFCPDPFLGLDDNTNLWCDEITAETVYYNACTGDILGSKEEKDGQSYCSRIADTDTVAATVPTWLPEGWAR